MTDLLLVGGLLAGVFLASYVIEVLRSPPDRPKRLSWGPEIPVQYVELDGQRVRYIVTGKGSPLVLLHTLRTQLDMFQKVIPDLARHHRVYALDYPGHGWSDIPWVECLGEDTGPRDPTGCCECRGAPECCGHHERRSDDGRHEGHVPDSQPW